MKFKFRINSLKVLVTVAGLAVSLGVLASSARADQWDKKTTLTVNEPIQVTNTYLMPGTYVFKLMDSNSNRHIVQIFNSDQSRIVDTVLAINNYRLQPTDNSQFAFWETPPGTAKALRAWFYPGENYGQEFLYPKHPRQLEVASLITTTRLQTPAVVESGAEATSQQLSEPAAEPVTSPDATSYNEPAAIQQNDLDDSQPTDVDAAPAPAPTPEEAQGTAPEPQQSTPTTNELPKTASQYAPVGLFGVALLGLYGFLKMKDPF